MSDCSEVIVTSDACGSLWTVCVWDPRTGTSLMTYKGGGTTSSHCISLVGGDYLVCAEKSKPLIHVWPLNSQETSRRIERVVVPGCVSALCVSPNCDYCVLAIGEKLYIWDLTGGELLPVITRHFRSISCIMFTDDGSHFISGGQDGMVIVWPLNYLVSCQTSELLLQGEIGQPEPKYVFSDHSLPVTDLHVGHGGVQALLASVSGDHTCKIYNLADGKLLLSVVFDHALSAVTMSVTESEVFVGSVDGEICTFSLQHMPRSLDYHARQNNMLMKYKGHSMAITSLSASLDGVHLVSSSADGAVKIWDIKSKQCLREIKHKGPVTNAYFTLCPRHVFLNTFEPSSIVTNFKKKGIGESKDIIRTLKKDGFPDKDKMFSHNIQSPNVQASLNQDNLELKIQELTEINKKLYKFSVQKIVNSL